jgi:acetyl esterase/lipase
VVPVTIAIDSSNSEILSKQIYTILRKLGPGFEIPLIELEPVNAEWQGSGTEPDNLSGNFSGPVVLHLHGGGYITGSAAAERTATIKLSELTGARIFAVDYRLSPQNVFPAALLDAIIAYKFLVQPPEGANHSPVDPKNLIIAGDSAGVTAQSISVFYYCIG